VRMGCVVLRRRCMRAVQLTQLSACSSGSAAVTAERDATLAVE
jgi:hypothetical protein